MQTDGSLKQPVEDQKAPDQTKSVSTTEQNQPKEEEKGKQFPKQQLYSKQQQKQHQIMQQQLLQQSVAPKSPGFVTVNCTGCLILLQYPEGTKSKIKCPACNTIMHPLRGGPQ